MAKPTTIYKGGFSGFWFGFLVSAWCGGGLLWVEYSRDRPMPAAVGLGLLMFFGMLAFCYLLGFLKSRKAVAILATDGTTLTGWRAGPTGRGTRFAVPMAEIDKWRWFDAKKQRNVIAVLEFTHGRDVYRMSPYGARKMDVEAFRALAPMVVSDAVVHSSPSLIGTRYPHDSDSGLD